MNPEPKGVDLGGADFRRAAALLAHYTNNSPAGVNAVLDEATDAGRLRELCWTIPGIVAGLQAGWHTESVTAVLKAAAAGFAGREVTGI